MDPEDQVADPVEGTAVESVTRVPSDEPNSYKAATTEFEDAEAQRRALAEKFIKQSLSQWTLSADGEGAQRKRSLEEVEFNSGKHWHSDLRKDREDRDRVVIEINRTPQYLNQVSNEERLTRPRILVKPTGNGTDPQTAKIKQGMVRSIEQRSNATDVRDDAFYRMLEKGWAYYRVMAEWESERSHRMVIRTRDIVNDFSVYRDPAAQRKDFTDARWWHITDDMPQDEYIATFPNSALAKQINGPGSLTQVYDLGDRVKEWIGDNVVRVVEYMYCEHKEMLLYAIPSDDPDDPYNYIGKFEDEMTENDWVIAVRTKGADGSETYYTRPSFREKWHWAKHNAIEVLDGNDDLTAGREMIGKFAGIIPILGRKILVDEKPCFVGMVRDAMDPCLASDYWLSAVTEMVALGPKAPWIVAAKAVENHKEMWTNENIENYSFLLWDHVDEGGNPIPEPKRNSVETPIQAMTMILRFADDDLKRVMGIYAAGLGAPGPETSGTAIQSRQKESDTANYHFMKNLQFAIGLEARCFLSMMPDVYAQKQMVEITRQDGAFDKVKVNQDFKGPDNKTIHYDMSEDCDAEVEVGPSFETKRQEAMAGLTEYLKLDPGAAPLIGDIIAKNSDFPDADVLEARLKTRVPPEVQSTTDGSQDMTGVSPEFLAKYQQNTKMVEQLTQALQDIRQKVEQKQIEHQQSMELKTMELASQERQNRARTDAQMAIAAMKSDVDDLKELMNRVLVDFSSILKVQPAQPAAAAPAAAQPQNAGNGSAATAG